MKYDVAIEELLVRVIEVEAESLEDAYYKVEALYYNEDIVLSSDDFQSVNIEILGEIK